LGEADEDLAEHGEGEVGGRKAGAGVADPVAQKDEQGGVDKGKAGAAGVEGIKGKRGGEDECEEEGGGEPVYGGGGRSVISCCSVGDGREGEPLISSQSLFRGGVVCF